MPSERLKAAYKRHYAKAQAIAALTGKKLIINRRRMMETDIFPAVCWSAEKRGTAFVKDDVDGVRQLVRFVGIVEPESYGSHNCFVKDHRPGRYVGWYTDPDGYYYKDGSGLCWGVVVQLAGRQGKARFAAGYQFGGCDGGPTIDFSRIFEGPSGDVGAPVDNDAAREAARYADDLARGAAEEEREYQEEQRELEEEDEDEDLEAA